MAFKTDWSLRSLCYDNLQWNRDVKFREWLIKFISPRPNDLILDIGCGTGELWKLYRHSKKVVGIDTSPEMVKKSSNIITSHLINAYDFTKIPLKFNKIVMCMSLHHLNDKKILKEIFDYLRGGDGLIVCEGVCPSPSIFTWYETVMKIKEPERNCYTTNSLLELLRDFKTEYKTYKMSGVSLLNWLNNSDISHKKRDSIYDIHLNSTEEIKKLYDMRSRGNDIIMTWTFTVVRCRK